MKSVKKPPIIIDDSPNTNTELNAHLYSESDDTESLDSSDEPISLQIKLPTNADNRENSCPPIEERNFDENVS